MLISNLYLFDKKLQHGKANILKMNSLHKLNQNNRSITIFLVVYKISN